MNCKQFTVFYLNNLYYFKKIKMKRKWVGISHSAKHTIFENKTAEIPSNQNRKNETVCKYWKCTSLSFAWKYYMVCCILSTIWIVCLCLVLTSAEWWKLHEMEKKCEKRWKQQIEKNPIVWNFTHQQIYWTVAVFVVVHFKM